MIQPKEVSNLDLAFGPKNILEFLPPSSEIPKEFYSKCKAHDFITNWFYNGVALSEFPNVKTGVDKGKAILHIKCILSSWDPKHEYKIAGCAYLLDMWFEFK